jgi:hypothetical protein
MASQRHKFSDLSRIKDPLMTYNFNLLIANVPGGGDGEQLMLRCQSASIPGMQIDQVAVDLRGMTLRYAGRHVYNGTFSASYIEARDIKTRSALLRWMYFARDFRNASGNYKADYATNIDVELFDDREQTVIRTIRCFGAFPYEVQEVQLESGASTNAVIQVSFSYDWFQDLEDL